MTSSCIKTKKIIGAPMICLLLNILLLNNMNTLYLVTSPVTSSPQVQMLKVVAFVLEGKEMDRFSLLKKHS